MDAIDRRSADLPRVCRSVLRSGPESAERELRLQALLRAGVDEGRMLVRWYPGERAALDPIEDQEQDVGDHAGGDNP